MDHILKCTDFDVEKVKYSDIKPMGTSGAKSMYVNYDGSYKGVVIHTPKMRLPFGVGKFEEPGKQTKYSLDLSLDDMESDPKMKEFHDTIKKLDNKILADAKKNSLTWLRKKDVSDEVLQTLYSSPIKIPKDCDTGEPTDKYPPTFKAKLPFWDNRFSCTVFDHERKKFDGDFTDHLTKGSRVVAIVKCGGVWFAAGKFGVTWKVEQMKLDKPRGLVGYSFRDDDDTDDMSV